jgi:hypothetical protein
VHPAHEGKEEAMTDAMMDPTDDSMMEPGSEVSTGDTWSDSTVADSISDADPNVGDSQFGPDTHFGSSVYTDAFRNEWKYYPDGSYEKLN